VQWSVRSKAVSYWRLWHVLREVDTNLLYHENAIFAMAERPGLRIERNRSAVKAADFSHRKLLSGISDFVPVQEHVGVLDEQVCLLEKCATRIRIARVRPGRQWWSPP
jgi:hypothetical protein